MTVITHIGVGEDTSPPISDTSLIPGYPGWREDARLRAKNETYWRERAEKAESLADQWEKLHNNVSREYGAARVEISRLGAVIESLEDSDALIDMSEWETEHNRAEKAEAQWASYHRLAEILAAKIEAHRAFVTAFREYETCEDLDKYHFQKRMMDALAIAEGAADGRS